MNALTLPKLKNPDHAFVQGRLGPCGFDACLQLSWSDTETGAFNPEQREAFYQFLAANKTREKVIRLPAKNPLDRSKWHQEVIFDRYLLSESAGYPITVCFANEIGKEGAGARPLPPDVSSLAPKGTISPLLLEYWAFRLAANDWSGVKIVGCSFQNTDKDHGTELGSFMASPHGRYIYERSDMIGMNQYGNRYKAGETINAYAKRFMDEKITRKRGYFDKYGLTKPMLVTEYGIKEGQEKATDGEPANPMRLADLRESLVRLDFGPKCYFKSVAEGTGSEVGYGLYKNQVPVGREISNG